MRNFDCKVCHFKQLHKKRTCYLYDRFPDGSPGHRDGDAFDVPRFEVDGTLMRDGGLNGAFVVERRFLSQDDFLEVLWDMNENLPHLSAWQLLNGYFKEVCPTAFVDPILSSLISAQASCSEYKLDITNDHIRTELLGFYMTLRDTLEAFDIIVGSRNAYERYEQERIEKEAERKRKSK